MTKAELRTYAKQLTGNQTSSTLTDSWYDERVLAGYRRLATFQGMVTGPAFRHPKFRVLRFPTLESRMTRTLDSTLTSNFVANQSGVEIVVDIYDRTNNVGLSRESETDIKQRDPDETDTPRLWRPAAESGVMGYYIWPYPATAAHAIDVYEYVVPTLTLASDSTEPNVPDEWHPAIGLAAGAEVALLLDMPERRTELNQQFMEQIAERVSPGERAALGGIAGARRRIVVGGW